MAEHLFDAGSTTSGLSPRLLPPAWRGSPPCATTTSAAAPGAQPQRVEQRSAPYPPPARCGRGHRFCHPVHFIGRTGRMVAGYPTGVAVARYRDDCRVLIDIHPVLASICCRIIKDVDLLARACIPVAVCVAKYSPIYNRFPAGLLFAAAFACFWARPLLPYTCHLRQRVDSVVTRRHPSTLFVKRGMKPLWLLPAPADIVCCVTQ